MFILDLPFNNGRGEPGGASAPKGPHFLFNVF